MGAVSRASNEHENGGQRMDLPKLRFAGFMWPSNFAFICFNKTL